MAEHQCTIIKTQQDTISTQKEDLKNQDIVKNNLMEDMT